MSEVQKFFLFNFQNHMELQRTLTELINAWKILHILINFQRTAAGQNLNPYLLRTRHFWNQQWYLSNHWIISSWSFQHFQCCWIPKSLGCIWWPQKSQDKIPNQSLLWSPHAIQWFGGWITENVETVSLK